MERFRQPEIKPKDSSEAPRQTIRLKSDLVLRARKSRTTSVAAASENGCEKGKKKVQLTRAASAATKDAVREAKRKRMGVPIYIYIPGWGSSKTYHRHKTVCIDLGARSLAIK